MSNQPQIDALKAERQSHLDRAKELNRDIKALERANEIAARVGGGQPTADAAPATPAPAAPAAPAVAAPVVTTDPEATLEIPGNHPAAVTREDLDPTTEMSGAPVPPPPAPGQ